MIETAELRVRLTFTDELLGTSSGDPELHANYIASKAPDAESMEDEIAAIGVEDEIRKTMTVFPRDTLGRPVIWDYQIKGFFKESAGFMKQAPGAKTEKFAAHKKKVDGLIFVKERMIPLMFDGEMGVCQRPLRASTAKGERVALASSETVPAGAVCEFTIQTLSTKLLPMIREWLDYGALHGLLQWRNSGKGRFTWEEIS